MVGCMCWADMIRKDSMMCGRRRMVKVGGKRRRRQLGRQDYKHQAVSRDGRLYVLGGNRRWLI